jgi:hypothetical protein
MMVGAARRRLRIPPRYLASRQTSRVRKTSESRSSDDEYESTCVHVERQSPPSAGHGAFRRRRPESLSTARSARSQNAVVEAEF